MEHVFSRWAKVPFWLISIFVLRMFISIHTNDRQLAGIISTALILFFGGLMYLMRKSYEKGLTFGKIVLWPLIVAMHIVVIVCVIGLFSRNIAIEEGDNLPFDQFFFWMLLINMVFADVVLVYERLSERQTMKNRFILQH